MVGTCPDPDGLTDVPTPPLQSAFTVARLQTELDAEVAYSQQLASGSGARKPGVSSAHAQPSTHPGGGSSSTVALGAGVGAAEAERAIRRLYEDLTGLVVSSVERNVAELDEQGGAEADFKVFKGVFAAQGFYGESSGVQNEDAEETSVDR